MSLFTVNNVIIKRKLGDEETSRQVDRETRKQVDRETSTQLIINSNIY